MTTTLRATTGRDLVTGELFGRLVRRVAEDNYLCEELADRVVDQALVFLATHAQHGDLRPSAMVDLGWHVFLLHTREYAAFCDRMAGRFLHHEPDDAPREGLGSTVAAVSAAGYEVDRELWSHPARCGEVGCAGGRPPGSP